MGLFGRKRVGVEGGATIDRRPQAYRQQGIESQELVDAEELRRAARDIQNDYLVQLDAIIRDLYRRKLRLEAFNASPQNIFNIVLTASDGTLHVNSLAESEMFTDNASVTKFSQLENFLRVHKDKNPYFDDEFVTVDDDTTASVIERRTVVISQVEQLIQTEYVVEAITNGLCQPPDRFANTPEGQQKLEQAFTLFDTGALPLPTTVRSQDLAANTVINLALAEQQGKFSPMPYARRLLEYTELPEDLETRYEALVALQIHDIRAGGLVDTTAADRISSAAMQIADDQYISPEKRMSMLESRQFEQIVHTLYNLHADSCRSGDSAQQFSVENLASAMGISYVSSALRQQAERIRHEPRPVATEEPRHARKRTTSAKAKAAAGKKSRKATPSTTQQNEDSRVNATFPLKERGNAWQPTGPGNIHVKGSPATSSKAPGPHQERSQANSPMSAERTNPGYTELYIIDPLTGQPIDDGPPILKFDSPEEQQTNRTNFLGNVGRTAGVGLAAGAVMFAGMNTAAAAEVQTNAEVGGETTKSQQYTNRQGSSTGQTSRGSEGSNAERSTKSSRSSETSQDQSTSEARAGVIPLANTSKATPSVEPSSDAPRSEESPRTLPLDRRSESSSEQTSGPRPTESTQPAPSGSESRTPEQAPTPSTTPTEPDRQSRENSDSRETGQTSNNRGNEENQTQRGGSSTENRNRSNDQVDQPTGTPSNGNTIPLRDQAPREQDSPVQDQRGQNEQDKDRRERPVISEPETVKVTEVKVAESPEEGTPGIMISVAERAKNFAGESSDNSEQATQDGDKAAAIPLATQEAPQRVSSQSVNVTVPGGEQQTPTTKVRLMRNLAKITGRSTADIYSSTPKVKARSIEVQQAREDAYLRSGAAGMTLNDLTSQVRADVEAAGYTSEAVVSTEARVEIDDWIETFKKGPQTADARDRLAHAMVGLDHPQLLDKGVLDPKFTQIPAKIDGKELTDADRAALELYIQEFSATYNPFTQQDRETGFFPGERQETFLRAVTIASFVNSSAEDLTQIIERYTPEPELEPEPAPAPEAPKVNDKEIMTKVMKDWGVPAEYIPLYIKYADQYNVPRSLTIAQGKQESQFKKNAVSPAGAKGLSQAMDKTWREWKAKLNFPADASPFDPEYSIHFQAAYMQWNLEKADGNVPLALAGYNAGWGNISEHGASNVMNNWGETREYIRIITDSMAEIDNSFKTQKTAAEAAAEKARRDAEAAASRDKERAEQAKSEGFPFSPNMSEQGRKETLQFAKLPRRNSQILKEGYIKPLMQEKLEKKYKNGKIPENALERAGNKGHLLQPAAARAWNDMAAAFARDNPGHKLEIGGPISGYRSYAEQKKIEDSPRASKAGTSNHGWGLAVDVAMPAGGAAWSSIQYRWLETHANEYGFWHRQNHDRNGKLPEAWHWEFWLTDY